MSSAATSTIVKGACGLQPEKALDQPTRRFWEPGTIISYSFYGGTDNQKNAVNKVAPEWFKYAKLHLQQRVDKDPNAFIRITFDSNAGSWSSIGRGAQSIKDGKPTMNLGWIENSPVISDFDRGTILHEWGHALGMRHEHQSPARGGSLHLNPDAITKYYHATQEWSDSLIQSEILDIYSKDDVSNFSKIDTNSVMRFFMPGSLNDKGVDVNVNTKLSDLDKAYMVINYTKDVPDHEAAEWTLEHALDVAGVSADKRKDILDCRGHPNEIWEVFNAWVRISQAKGISKTFCFDRISVADYRQPKLQAAALMKADMTESEPEEPAGAPFQICIRPPPSF